MKILFCSALVMANCLPLLAQGQPSRLVVDDVLFAKDARGTIGFSWGSRHPIWDFSGDGLPESLLIGEFDYPTDPSALTSGAKILKSGAGKPVWMKTYNRFRNGFTRPGSKQTIFLPTPSSLRSAREAISQESIGIFDWTLETWRWVQIPKAPYGITGHKLSALSDVGDVDGDGFFDIGCRITGFDMGGGLVALLSVVSGRTLEPIWAVGPQPTKSFGFFNYLGVESGNASGADANGDGYLDVMTEWWSGTNSEELYRCLSGSDGSVLWETTLPNHNVSGWWNSPNTARVHDLDNDGVLDVIGYMGGDTYMSSDPGYIVAISGRDGSQLWRVDRNDYDSEFSAGTSILELFKFYPWADHDNDGFIDLDANAKGVSNSGGGTTNQLWIFSGFDGAHIGAIDFQVSNLEPWSTDPVSFSDVIIKPDFNGDGWPECEIGVPNGSQPGSHLILLSPETLRFPDQVQAGQPVGFELSIPSSPSKDFQLLFSSTFLHHEAGRKMLGAWDTQLGVDATTALFATDPQTGGTLDSTGRFSGQLDIPAGQGLENTKIYVRGIIKDASAPSGIKAMTTLSTIAIHP